MIRKSILSALFLIIALMLTCFILKGLEIIEYKRMKNFCFTVRPGDTLESAINKVEKHFLYDYEIWSRDRLDEIGINRNITSVESLLSLRTISCQIKNDGIHVINTSAGSHFWAWMYK